MIEIYHNPRCSKSRAGLKYLEDKSVEFKVVKYLDENISFEEVRNLIDKLQLRPIELVRTKEKEWIENYRGKNLSDDEIISAMVSFPKLIERPIVVNGNKAVIARPTEIIETIL